MKDLNLLRLLGYDIQDDPRQLKSLLYGGTAALLALAAYTGHMGYTVFLRGQLAQQVEQLNEQIKDRRGQVAPIDAAVAALETESVKEREHIATLREIQKNLALFASERRARVERVLRDTVIATPASISLTSLTRDSSQLRLVGHASSGIEVAQYIRALGRVNGISAANLEHMEEAKIKDTPRYDFEILCSTR